MPHSPLSPACPGPRRRSLLVCASGVGAALLAGCTAGSEPDRARAESAEAKARARAARDSELLLAQYDAVIAAHPGLTSTLVPLRTEVARHVSAFGGKLAQAGARAAGPSPSAALDSPSPKADVPDDEPGALAFLSAAERTLTERRERALLEVPGETARLLASVAAGGAVHTYLLTKGR